MIIIMSVSGLFLLEMLIPFFSLSLSSLYDFTIIHSFLLSVSTTTTLSQITALLDVYQQINLYKIGSFFFFCISTEIIKCL